MEGVLPEGLLSKPRSCEPPRANQSESARRVPLANMVESLRNCGCRKAPARLLRWEVDAENPSLFAKLDSPMRWPLRYQILFPFAGVMLAVVLGVSLLDAVLAARRTQRQIERQLHDVAQTLLDANFPLTDAVLKQTGGLSGPSSC